MIDRDFQEIEQRREFNEGLAYEEYAGYASAPYTDDDWRTYVNSVQTFVSDMRGVQDEIRQLRADLKELEF